jgi:hypothetical protein
MPRTVYVGPIILAMLVLNLPWLGYRWIRG